MSKYMNPFTDYGFKKLFGEAHTKVYLIDFLNSILEGHISPILEIQHRRTDMLGATQTDRTAIFDLYCITQNGERIIIELQKVKQENFKDRSLYYSTFAIHEQNQKGKVQAQLWGFKLSPVYCLGILDFDFGNKEKYLHIGKILDVEDYEVMMNNLNFAFLEMPKFKKDIANCQTKKEKWVYILQQLAYLQEVPQQLKEEVFLGFFHNAEINALTGEEKAMYENSLKYYRDLHSLETENYDRGQKEKAIEIAKKMKAKNRPVEYIIEDTGLSAEEIKQL